MKVDKVFVVLFLLCISWQPLYAGSFKGKCTFSSAKSSLFKQCKIEGQLVYESVGKRGDSNKIHRFCKCVSRWQIEPIKKYFLEDKCLWNQDFINIFFKNKVVKEECGSVF